MPAASSRFPQAKRPPRAGGGPPGEGGGAAGGGRGAGGGPAPGGVGSGGRRGRGPPRHTRPVVVAVSIELASGDDRDSVSPASFPWSSTRRGKVVVAHTD